MGYGLLQRWPRHRSPHGHPLSAVYDIPMVRLCAMLLTAVLKFNAPATGENIEKSLAAMGVPNVDAMDEATYRQAAIDVIQKLLMT